MRNLKKVLSLVLALAMMLSMMAFASAAEKKAITSADLTDMDQVNNKAAVSLLVDLGIINGIEQEDGTYKYEPAMGINRASFAKLVYYVMTGEADASAYKGLDLGLKDVAGHWAEGEIAYCVANKIAAGDLEKNFYPDADITVVGAAKMLLTALGYDATLSKYENDQLWSLNIMNDAKKAGIMAGVSQAANEVLTRDNAAQMVFNALNAITVYPVVQYDMGTAYLSGYEADTQGELTLGQQIYGLQEVTATVSSLTKGKAGLTDVNPAINANAYTNVFAGSAALLGQKVTFYVQMNKGAWVKTWSSALVPGGSVLLGSSTSGVNVDTLADSKTPGNVNFKAELDDAVTYFANGVSSNKAGVDAIGTTAGNLVELYDNNGNGKADVVKATTYSVATINSVEVKNGPNGVEVTLGGMPTLKPGEMYVGYEGLVKDDVVLYTTIDGVYYIEKAEVVTGVATGLNSKGQVLVNGSYLTASGLKKDVLKDWNDYTNEYNFYLDKGGCVVAKVQITEEAAPTEYLYVLDNGFVTGGGGVSVNTYMEAQVLLADGTTEVVTLGAIKDTDGKTDIKDMDSINGNDDLIGMVFSYTVDPKTGVYNVVKAATTEIAEQTTAGGKVQFVKEATANAKTTFVVEITPTAGPKTYATYTGYANLPELLKAQGDAVVDSKSKMATLVFLQATGVKGEETAIPNVYLLDPDTYTYVIANGNPVGITTQAVVEGKVVDLLFDGTSGLPKDAGLYNIGEVVDGVAKAASVKPVDGTVNGVKGDALTLANGVVQVDNKTYSYDADTVLYVIDLRTGTVTETNVDSYTVDAGATYSVYVLDQKNEAHANVIYLSK